jgi:hypothetical protein
LPIDQEAGRSVRRSVGWRGEPRVPDFPSANDLIATWTFPLDVFYFALLRLRFSLLCSSLLVLHLLHLDVSFDACVLFPCVKRGRHSGKRVALDGNSPENPRVGAAIREGIDRRACDRDEKRQPRPGQCPRRSSPSGGTHRPMAMPIIDRSLMVV